MPRLRILVPVIVLAAGAVALAVVQPWRDEGGSEEPATPGIARPRTGPPPVPGPGHSVNYPKPPEENPKPFPPWRFENPPPVVEPPEPNPPQTFADLVAEPTEGSSRCREGARKHLYVLDHDELDVALDAEAALHLEGSLVLAEGRGLGGRALPLAVLLNDRDGAVGLEAWPCAGEPLHFTAAQLAASPERYVLVLSRNRGFKVIDREAARPGPILRNLAAIRILR